MKIKIMNLLKKVTWLRKLVRKVLHGKRTIGFKIRTLGIQTQENLVLFFAFKGKSYGCSPKAIYEYMIKQEKYQNYQFLWAFKEPEKYRFLEENRNTKVIAYGGKQYQKALARAKYWFFNYRLEDHLYPKKDQVYVQCWHGTPLKKLGYDLKDTHNALNTESEIHNKYKIDAKKFKFMLSPSPFATEKFISAWNLKATNMEHKMIEEGYPRNDFLYNYTKEQVEEIKQKLNLPNKKIILYAPTFRDNQHQSGVGYTYQTQVDFDLLREELEQDYIILFRAHYLVANSFDFEKYQGFIYNVSDYDDINHLYVISDVLITDYSSVFFDYANLQRPIIFYMYDFEEYKDELRGFYIDLKELPGKITKNEKELLQAIKEVKDFTYQEIYHQFNQKYNLLDDGQAAKRVVEKVIQ